MPIDVFMSIGRTATDQQDRFVAAVERLLTEHGLTPRRATWSSVQPLKKVEEVLATCCGTVIVAFERLVANEALELRGGAKQKRIADLRLPTVWNQIEAALGYSRGYPLLVICENGLRSEGLLEKGYDWYVQLLDIDPREVDTPEFRGVFEDWNERVKNFHETRSALSTKGLPNPAEAAVAELLGALKPAQLWGTLAALVSVIVFVAGVAYKLGH